MSIRVGRCTARELLRGCKISAADTQGGACSIEGRLSIPEYQRPYRWGKAQISRLLRDLKDQQVGATNDVPYFLGTVILHDDGAGRLNLIDGQQRVTTLALMDYLSEPGVRCALEFEHPSSQQCIHDNLQWLADDPDGWKDWLSLDGIEFSLVVTGSLDDAYLFFETQNTGGVRLQGPDIIKAYHLRAIEGLQYQQQFAKQWEAMESNHSAEDAKSKRATLNDTALALLRGRAWQGVDSRELPSHRQPEQVRRALVSEFADQTGKGCDVAYGLLVRRDDLAGRSSERLQVHGYALAQPLNAGINSVRYLAWFRQLHRQYWIAPGPTLPNEYRRFIVWLQGLEGCGYLHDLFVSCLLLYISRFGEQDLTRAAKKLFRVVYAPRMTNERAVRESSIYAFVRKQPVLDWITQSYTPAQCLARLDAFELKPEPSNLNKNGVKQRFFAAAIDFFGLRSPLPTQDQDKDVVAYTFCRPFAQELCQAIEKELSP